MKKTLSSLVLGATLALGGISSAKASQDFTYNNVTNNTSLVPTEQTEYLIEASSANTSQGTVSGPTNDWLLAGTSTNLVASPNTTNHYHFVNWTSGTNQVSTNTNYAFTADSPTNLVANFDIDRFTVNIQNGANYGLNPTNFVNIPYGGSITSTAANVYYTNAPGRRTKIIGLH
jgi:hypothetical protein